MEGQIKIISEPDDPLLDFALLIIGFLALGMGIYFVAKGIDIYPQLRSLGQAFLFLVIAVALIYRYYYELETLYLYDDRIVIKTRLGRLKKVIYRNGIKAWIENQEKRQGKKTKRGEIKQISYEYELIVFYEGGKHSIRSSRYYNYGDLKNAIVADKPYGAPREYRSNYVTNIPYTAALISGFLLFLYPLIYPANANESGEKTGLTSLSAVVSGNPQTIYYKGRFTLYLKVQNYPDFDFAALFWANGVDEWTVKSIEAGDTVKIDISTDVYLKKLVKEKPLGFLDKTLDYRLISIYGLHFKGTNCTPLTGNGYYYLPHKGPFRD